MNILLAAPRSAVVAPGRAAAGRFSSRRTRRADDPSPRSAQHEAVGARIPRAILNKHPHGLAPGVGVLFRREVSIGTERLTRRRTRFPSELSASLVAEPGFHRN